MLLQFFAIAIVWVSPAALQCVVSVCPDQLVFVTQRGDSICDTECMTQGCDFDGGTGVGVDDTSDCWTVCLLTGCSRELLDNSSCDPQCDTAECGWDNGVCGVCASGCNSYSGSKALLEDAKCDLICNTAECGFDNGVCGACADGCLAGMIGDGHCDMPCLNDNCWNDSPDCDSLQCSPGCFPPMLADSVCQQPCQTQSCGYDSPDCDCAPDCSASLLLNTVCDEPCKSALCGFDGNHCVKATQGECAIGCFARMLGDGVCDWECYNAACAWDGLDCGCAANCASSEYGQCNDACLRPECHYDAVPGFPSCSDTAQIAAATVYQAIAGSLVVTYPFEIVCAESAATCTMANWLNSVTSCVSECAGSLACLGSFGNCPTPCPDHCEKCLDPTRCIVCASGFVRFFTECVVECPVSFRDISGICGYADEEDETKTDSPDVLYVSRSSGTSGTGTINSPFRDISEAIVAVHRRFTGIYLMSGVHKLAASVASSRLHLWKDTALFPAPQPATLTIEPLACTAFPTHPECCQSPPTLLFDNLTPVRLIIAGSMTITGVILSGDTSLVSGCIADTCRYCPSVTVSKAGVVDDRGATITDFASQNLCDKFHAYSLISIEPMGTLLMVNATFEHFREEFSSLIQFSQGVIELINVRFVNVTTYTSVVAQTGEMHDFSCFSMRSGSVELINNGYEYRSGEKRGGFLTALEVKNITFHAVTFHRNIVGELLSAQNFYLFALEHCSFALTIGTILRIDSTAVRDYSENRLRTRPPNLQISHCAYHNTTGQVLLLSMSGDLLTTLVANCSFSSLSTIDTDMIDIHTTRDLTLADKRGAMVSSYREGKRYITGIGPANFTFINLYFDNCQAAHILSISNAANLRLSNVTIIDCGDTNVHNINTDVLQSLVASQDSYISLVVLSPAAPQCFGLISVSSVSAVEFYLLNVTRNVCGSGPAGLLVSSTLDYLTINSSVFRLNIGKSPTSATLMDISLSSKVVFHRLSVTNNTHTALTGKGGIAITAISPSGSILVSASSIQYNAIPDGGAMNIYGNASLSATLLEWNTASGSTSAGLVFTPSPFGSALTLDSVTFRGNSAVTGAALMLFDQSATRVPIHLVIARSLFDLNRSQGYGSCVLIDPSVRLSAYSVIDSSTFTNNTAANGSLWVAFSSGVLTVSNTVFRGSVGANAAALYCQHPRSVDPEVMSIVVLRNTVMEYCSGYAAIYFSNPGMFTEGQATNFTLRYNFGRGLYLQYTYWQDTNSRYLNNTSPTSGSGYIIIFYSIAVLSNCTFTGNSAKFTAGGTNLSIFSKVTISNSTFVGNYAERGGAVYTEQGATMIMNNCRLQGNRADKEGSAMYLFTGPLTSANSTISNTVFLENNSKSGSGTIALITSLLIVSKSTFRSNRASSAAGFLLYLSTLSVISSEFEGQEADVGVFIMSAASSGINVTDCVMKGGRAREKGGAIYISSSVLYVLNSLFFNLSSSSGSAISSLSSSTIHLYHSSFHSLSSSRQYGGAVQLTETAFTDEFSQYSDIHNGVITGLNSYVEVIGGAFRYGDSSSGAGIYCEDCQVVTVRSADFRNFTAEKGACVHLSSSTGDDWLFVDNTSFTDSTAGLAGAVLLQNLNANLSNCSFQRNSAQTDSGGAMLLTCSSALCSVSIANTRFVANTALRNGGAVYWTDRKPTIDNGSFVGNQAKYGANVASFAVSLILSGDSQDGELKEVASGQKAKYTLTVRLVDHYGEVVETDSDSLADLLPANSQSVSVSGSTRIQSASGVFSFTDYSITAHPGLPAALLISTNGIQPSKVIASDLETPYQPSISIIAHMRNCTIGESLVAESCYMCPEGKYSLDPALPCINCPTGAVCYGNATMAPQPGYWRANQETDVFWECPNPDSCLGANETEDSAQGECLAGYYGNLCQGCISGYSRKQRDYCSECPDASVNSLQIAAIIVAIVAVCVVIIKMSLLSAHKAQSHSSIFLKIFVNYLQLTAATCSFNMNWPKYALNTFKVQENVANVSMQLFSFDCFLDNGQESTQADTFYVKMTVIGLVPIGILAGSVAFWSIIAGVYRRKGYLKYQMVNSVVVLFFIAHPSIITFMFDVFNCRQINPGEYWLSSYLNIRCWDRVHSRYAMSLALPSLLLWGICAPLFALLSLIALRRRLGELEMRIRLGFLYTGYEAGKYYWEFVILYRKMIVITMAVFLTNVSTNIQVLAVLLVLVLAYVLQIRNSPYNIIVFNQLEKRSILVAAATIYCGLFYMSHDLEYYSRVLLFILIISFNAYFLTYWLLKICQAGFRFLSKRCPCVLRIMTSLLYKSMNKTTAVEPVNMLDAELSFSLDRSAGLGRGQPPVVPDNSLLDVSGLSRHYESSFITLQPSKKPLN